MAAIEPGSRFKSRAVEALEAGDFGEDQGGGVYFKSLGRIGSNPKNGEIERASSVPSIKPKTRAEKAEIPRKLALQALDYYIGNMNNPNILNPIRDGIPQCVAHPFKPGVSPGCMEGCTTGLLPTAREVTLGDVFEWLKGMIAFNYRRWERKNPAFKGYTASLK